MRAWTHLAALGLALLLAPGLSAEQVEWTESKDLKTKTIYDQAGNIVYQGHWDRRSGKMVGEPLDLRGERAAPPRATPAPAPEPTSSEVRPGVRFSTKAGKLVLVAQSLVRVRLRTELHSGRNTRGDRFEYQLLDDISHGGRVLLPKWSKGEGVVLFARKRGMFGSSGRLELDFGEVQLAGGESVRLVLDKASEEANKMAVTAAGTSAGGALILGPIGLVGGVFIKGRDVHIPKGTITYLAVAEDVVVGG